MRRLLLVAALPLLAAASPPGLPAPGVTGLPPPAMSSIPAPAVSPAPFAPPAAIIPAPATNDAPSPLLTRPGPLYPATPNSGSSALPPSYPSAIDQQRLQTYRSQLQSEQRILEDQGVSPSDQRLRDIQQQLNQPSR